MLILHWDTVHSDDLVRRFFRSCESIEESELRHWSRQTHFVCTFFWILALSLLCCFSRIATGKEYMKGRIFFSCTLTCFVEQYNLRLEKEMATHSSILAWEIPWMEEPGGLQSKGLQRVGHGLVTSLSLFTFITWYADDTTLMAESEEDLKSLLKKVKEESEKVGLKLNIQKTKIMASGPITSWEIDGETVETVSDFCFFGLQNHCRWWLQPWN